MCVYVCFFNLSFPLGLETQLWRLENEGCLKNKAHMDKCLELEHHIDGALVVLKPETGLDIQKWTFDNNFIVNKVHNFQYENSLLS